MTGPREALPRILKLPRNRRNDAHLVKLSASLVCTSSRVSVVAHRTLPKLAGQDEEK